MYWSDWGTKPVIVRAHLSGANRTNIISTNLRWPNGVTIDYVEKKIYWTDAGKDRIERANLDGSSREVGVPFCNSGKLCLACCSSTLLGMMLAHPKLPLTPVPHPRGILPSKVTVQ